MARRRIAVLISGRGTNLQALIDATSGAGSLAEIVLVVGSRAEALGLERARGAGIRHTVIEQGGFPDRTAYDAALDAALRSAGAELVCLAGFMHILTADFVERWRDRMLNIHPSLLPAFRGLDTHARALAAGVQVHGCTVHLVRPELDTGPALVQGVVPVMAEDTPERLAARVLDVEHRCYPLALHLLASGRVEIAADSVRLRSERPGERLVVHPLLKEAAERGSRHAD